MVLKEQTDAAGPVAFTADELTALAELVGANRFVGVAEPRGAGPQAREASLREARLGLLARGVVGLGADGTPELAPEYAELVTVPLAAELVVAVERRDRTQTFGRHFYAQPGAAVEHAVVLGGIHRLSRFPTPELAARIVDFSGLRKTSKPDGSPFTTDNDAFALLRDGVRTGDLSSAREALGADGAAFADAMESFASWCLVRILRRRNGTAAGGDTTWIDAGDALWRLESETSRGGPTRVTITPTGAREIADDIVSRLIGDDEEWVDRS